jgi:hypothetical protein
MFELIEKQQQNPLDEDMLIDLGMNMDIEVVQDQNYVKIGDEYYLPRNYIVEDIEDFAERNKDKGKAYVFSLSEKEHLTVDEDGNPDGTDFSCFGSFVFADQDPVEVKEINNLGSWIDDLQERVRDQYDAVDEKYNISNMDDLTQIIYDEEELSNEEFQIFYFKPHGETVDEVAEKEEVEGQDFVRVNMELHSKHFIREKGTFYLLEKPKDQRVKRTVQK